MLLTRKDWIELLRSHSNACVVMVDHAGHPMDGKRGVVKDYMVTDMLNSRDCYVVFSPGTGYYMHFESLVPLRETLWTRVKSDYLDL